jgi:hypothetical protein
LAPQQPNQEGHPLPVRLLASTAGFTFTSVTADWLGGAELASSTK